MEAWSYSIDWVFKTSDGWDIFSKRQEIKGGERQGGGKKEETSREIIMEEHSTKVYSGFSQEFTVYVNSFPLCSTVFSSAKIDNF